MAAAHGALEPLFHPRSVAVVGASATPGSVGNRLLRNLLDQAFGGVIYPVNPNRRSVQGVAAYPRLADVPEPVDLAILATRAATVPAQLEQAIACGARAAIVVAAGFAAHGGLDRALEERIAGIARGKIRVLGPNCLGVMVPPSHLHASFAGGMPRSGKVALISQSGAICTSILDWSRMAQFGFSAIVSVGTMVDIDFADLIDHFGDDAETQSIIVYMESMGDARSFLSAARAVARTKPIIVVKAGRHEAGARAALSHTGALAGSDEVFEAALRRAGVLRVDTVRDLFQMSELLAMQPQPKGPALGILGNAGAPAIMAVDALLSSGGTLAEFTPATLAALEHALPPVVQRANPLDLHDDAPPLRYRQAAEIALKDERTQGLLVLLAPQALCDPHETARQIAPLAHVANKPILAAWMGGDAVRTGRSHLQQAGIPTFDTPEAAVRSFLHMVQYRRAQELLYETPEAVPEFVPALERVRGVIAQARAAERRLLTEEEAQAVLGAYEIPMVPTRSATCADDAVAQAQVLGFPVALKLRSAAIPHKSAVGGVRLHLRDEQAVRDAFAAIRTRAHEAAQARSLDPDAVFAGVCVQPMAAGPGVELIVGSSLDPQFGPVILFGAGGVLVEILRDRSLALPPLNRTLARRLIERTRIVQALRPSEAAGPNSHQLAPLETLLVRFSQLVADQPDIAEIEINPLHAGPDGWLGLDARVVLAEEPASPDAPSRLAILPYPNQYTTPFTLADGTEVVIRVIRPEDEPLIVTMHATLSENTIRMRYFSMVKKLTHERLIRLCHLDYSREIGLVAIQQGPDGPRSLGVSRYHYDPETGASEFAVLVADPYQGKKLGKHLMERLIAVARDRKVPRLTGQVLRENTSMLVMCKLLGFRDEPTADPSIVEMVLELH